MRIVRTMTPVYRQKSSYLKKLRKRKKLSKRRYLFIFIHTHTHEYTHKRTGTNSLTPLWNDILVFLFLLSGSVYVITFSSLLDFTSRFLQYIERTCTLIFGFEKSTDKETARKNI